MAVVMGGRGRMRWRFVIGRRRHEGEDCVQAEGADECETVDISEMNFSGEEEEGAEEEEEEDGAREVGVVHYMLGYGR